MGLDQKVKTARTLFWIGTAPWVTMLGVLVLTFIAPNVVGGMDFIFVLFFGGIVSAVISALCWVPSWVLLKHNRD